jgi:hypothetical protein
MSVSFMPIIISYRSRLWIKVGLLSFRRFFPDLPVLIIDNNPDSKIPAHDRNVEEERKWITRWRLHDHHHYFEKTGFPEKSHGRAMDWALRWCRTNGFDWMLHFEPDCLIDGTEWVNKLLDAAKKDIWMAGSHRKSYGPIHPTPSIWKVNQITSSFGSQRRGSDMNHPRFHELMDMKELLSDPVNRGGPNGYWETCWDTAQKPWFDCAVHDKAVLVEETPDFRHFWCGSTSRPDPARYGDPRVMQYLQ